MKKYIALIIVMALLLPQIMTIPSLSASNEVIIRTGAEFQATEMKDASKIYVIDGTETLADGSIGIILPDNYTSKTDFMGTIKGVTGKNNIQTTKTLISTVNANGIVRFDNLVLKGPDDGTGSITSTTNAGVLLSQVASASTYPVEFDNITNYVNVTVTSNNYGAAGILGFLRYRAATFKNCVNYGEMTSNGSSDNCAGGILANARDTASITILFDRCYNYGKITSSGFTGGIIGRNYNSTLTISATNCGNFGEISCNGAFSTSPRSVGGISGGPANVSNSFNAGKINSTMLAGGILGTALNTALIVENCFNIGNITTTDSTGTYWASGIVGSYSGTNVTVENSYNAGALSGAQTRQIVDTKTVAQDTLCVGNYYVSDTDLEQAVGTNITFDALATALPIEFSSDIWEILPANLLGDYINDDINCPSGYRYPQIKGNWIDHKLEADIESFEDYRSSLKGEITNVTTGWELIENVSNEMSVYATNNSGTKLVKRFTYPALFGSTLITGDMMFTSSDLSFDINKTAEVILAVNTSDVNSLDAVANGGFTQMFKEDGVTPLAFITDGGLVYYLVKKDVFVSSSETITIGAQSGLTNNFMVFVNWLNTYKLSIEKSGNETVYVNTVEKTDDTPIVALGGSSYTIKVEPKANYYIKKITVNNVVEVENSVVEYENTIVCNSDVDLVIETSEYLLKDSDTLDEILPPDYKVVQSSNASTGLIEQTLRIKGQMKSFLNGGTVIAEISKASTPLYTGSGVIGGEGNFEILFPLSDDEGILEIKLKVDKDGVVSDIPLDASKQTFEVASVSDINNLLLNLNTDNITAKDLENLILEEKASLPFEVGVFKNTSPYIRGLITTKLVGMDDYNIDNIYSRFDDAVIMCVANNSKNTADYVNIIKVYDEIINFSTSPLYAEYEGFTNYEKFAEILKTNTFSSYADLVDAFEYGVVYAGLSGVSSYDEIIDVLDTYKDVLDITDEVTTIFAMTDNKIKIVNEETGKNLNSLTTKALLKEKLNYLITNIDKLLRDKTAAQLPPRPSGGGGGGGSSISVEKDYVEKETTTPVYSEEVVNEFVDLGDVPWAQDHIRSLYKRGIVRGKELGNFYPQDKVTRAEFVKMVVVAFSLMEEEPSCKYIDVPQDHWSYKYVASAADIGIVSGYSANKFGVDGYITRQDMVAILIRVVYKLSLYEQMENRKITTADFTDVDTVSDYAKGGVVMLANSGIISGYEDGTFGPNNDVTRAEAATVLARALEFFEI